VRPEVILNCAASADGKISLPNRKQMAISNEKDFERVHKLRSECDAIIVGIGTIIEDNPFLTVRNNSGAKPIRVILDTSCRIPIDSNVLNGESETIIAVGNKSGKNNLETAEIIECGENMIDLTKLLNILRERGVKRVLVEGGETVMWSFLKEKLFDEHNVFFSSIIIGGTGTPTIAGGKGFQNEKSILNLKLVSVEQLGNGILAKYIKKEN
jgi:2,5-diamino-6-(ribosylamino)-4(3H)-pyrimidinone 5'-phosphate reductase|tara:strand:+ start:100 stop:735 length:636 start_codon:yes stop_codon:yes gene_type:complete